VIEGGLLVLRSVPPTRQHLGRFGEGRAGPRRRLSPVADIPCYTVWTAMGQDLPPALQIDRKTFQGQTCSPNRDRLSKCSFKG
jgi:hypothetical protein